MLYYCCYGDMMSKSWNNFNTFNHAHPQSIAINKVIYGEKYEISLRTTALSWKGGLRAPMARKIMPAGA
jgi:hypothetical protein